MKNKTNHSATGTAAFLLELETAHPAEYDVSLKITHTHLRCVAINQTCNQIRASSFFGAESLPQRKANDTHGFCSQIVPESSTWPLRSSGRGGGVLSAVHSGRVKAEWPNCLPLLSRKTRKPPVSLVIAEEH